MCITVNTAALSKTKILSLPLENGNHFIAYSNSVKNESGKPNAMILPIPGETTQSLFHNTENYKNFLDDIIEKAEWDEWCGMRSRGFLSKGLSVERFKLGIYDIVLTKNFDDVKKAIAEFPEEKRPEISEELQSFFQEKYAGWSFAVCFFDTNETSSSQPIAFEYKPFGGGRFIYFPTMDAHDGKAPKVGGMVPVDHTFIYEHTGPMTRKYYLEHIELGENVPEFLQKRKYRYVEMKGHELNNDTYIDTKALAETDFQNDAPIKRIEPVPYETI